MPDRTKISDNHGWMGECTGTQSVVCVRPELYLLVLYTDQWEDFSVLCTHQWNDLSCCILTNECTSWLVPWPVKTTWVEALLTMWSANLLYRLLLDYNRINEIQHCIFLYLKPVPTCCIKPKPFQNMELP